jgi:hypothetical protein
VLAWYSFAPIVNYLSPFNLEIVHIWLGSKSPLSLSTNFPNIPVLTCALYSWAYFFKRRVKSQSHYNKIYNNTISDSQYGIDVMFGSSGNAFYSNVVKNSSHGLVLDSTSNKSKNIFYNNQFINSHFVISRHSNKLSLDIAKNRGVRSNF